MARAHPAGGVTQALPRIAEPVPAGGRAAGTGSARVCSPPADRKAGDTAIGLLLAAVALARLAQRYRGGRPAR
ncbi:hypothetical protein C1N79_34640 (plasmid) [Streptomyces sp. SGAir0924]|nr:hypothetical protein C1N79_34640 [Streptomyces sp. SGAir0924]